ncbi:MAG: DUF4279 domain-containing protein [Myxococcales bacterium]|nr:DUF4279 domain-containing protein [Myxococcales bacterium]MCB9581178.1 DUF4279 domain-containing protein [Polyangiaceae bacterium]
MAEFRTLRGFTAGAEASEPERYAFSATLRVSGDDLDFAAIQAALGHSATSSYRKGHRRGPRSPEARHDMWQLASDLPEDRPLHEHIDRVWSQVRHATAFLIALKRSAKVDVFLGYSSNIDHAGFEIPHTSLEIFRALEIPLGVSIVIV